MAKVRFATNCRTGFGRLMLALSFFLAMLSLHGVAYCNHVGKKIHLFILSGQSNMEALEPQRTFTPTVAQALAGDEIVVVKEAVGGMPIRMWVKDWAPAEGRSVVDQQRSTQGEIYDRLMRKVRDAIKDGNPDTVTFVWMQGERDAREGHGEVYVESLRELIRQLRTDLKRDDINVVIGRLSDFSIGNGRFKHWDEVRGAQEQIAREDERAAWIDTDAWNGEGNELHYVKDGYDKLGKAFAEKALELISRFQKEASRH
jgi:hypothetical protein